MGTGLLTYPALMAADILLYQVSQYRSCLARKETPKSCTPLKHSIEVVSNLQKLVVSAIYRSIDLINKRAGLAVCLVCILELVVVL